MTAPKATPPEPPALDELLSAARVVAVTNRSRAALYRDVASGDFPAPIKTGRRSIAWRASDIRAWMQSRPLAAVGGKK